jgi:hypothetical protein
MQKLQTSNSACVVFLESGLPYEASRNFPASRIGFIMTANAISATAPSLQASTLFNQMGNFITQMVIAQGKALHEERMRTLREHNLKDHQSVLSYGSFV